jgi:hypothetical protein
VHDGQENDCSPICTSLGDESRSASSESAWFDVVESAGTDAGGDPVTPVVGEGERDDDGSRTSNRRIPSSGTL